MSKSKKRRPETRIKQHQKHMGMNKEEVSEPEVMPRKIHFGKKAEKQKQSRLKKLGTAKNTRFPH